MFKLVLLCGLLAVVLSATPDQQVPIVSQGFDLDPDGKFQWSYESGDGSKANQVGELRVIDKDQEGEVMAGSFQYKGTDGQAYSISYTADENGYHPEGAHLPVAPTPPPIPAAIARALEYIATARPPKK